MLYDIDIMRSSRLKASYRVYVLRDFARLARNGVWWRPVFSRATYL